MGALTRILISVTPQQLAWLRTVTENTGMGVTEIVRRAIDDYMRREPDPGLVVSRAAVGASGD